MDTTATELRLSFRGNDGVQRTIRLGQYDSDLNADEVEALMNAVIGAQIIGTGDVLYYAAAVAATKVATTTTVLRSYN
ncbi:DUF2922 domain-containing protein [Lacticaseibacillus daqingensis]|uniref:DUF2922 domain-containing protein n=1 Tax=Lacticaseibacillus daqingensis TaxID=2486014 RepID=UPI000F791183|nr:DUF2922 domain-containing protein [Lacticaseibacillus daqingensis]